MLALPKTGHVRAPDGALLRVDIMAGQWVATRYTTDLVVADRVVGTEESVRQQIAQWA
jgi:hypothetical protein